MKEIEDRMEKLRRRLEEVAKDKGDTCDLEVIAVSKTLDEVLNEYNKLLKRRAKIRRHRLSQLLDMRDDKEE